MRGLAVIAVIAAVIALPAPAAARTSPVRGRSSPPGRAIRGHSERLAARAQGGDREAQCLLVDEHMPLVRSVARRYRDLGLPLEDLTQEGAIGLCKAIGDFDASRGTSFTTYAFWRVRSEITHALTARAHLIRLPRPLLERHRDMTNARRSLVAAGREPTPAELAAATGHSADEIDEVLALPLAVDSLDSTTEDGVSRLALVAAPDDVPGDTATAHDEAAVSAAVARLSERKREIITRHFGLGRAPEPLARIATELDLSPARTRTLKDAALHELAAELEPMLAA